MNTKCCVNLFILLACCYTHIDMQNIITRCELHKKMSKSYILVLVVKNIVILEIVWNTGLEFFCTSNKLG